MLEKYRKVGKIGTLGAGGIGSIIDGVGKIADDLVTTDKERLEIALPYPSFYGSTRSTN